MGDRQKEITDLDSTRLKNMYNKNNFKNDAIKLNIYRKNIKTALVENSYSILL